MKLASVMYYSTTVSVLERLFSTLPHGHDVTQINQDVYQYESILKSRSTILNLWFVTL